MTRGPDSHRWRDDSPLHTRTEMTCRTCGLRYLRVEVTVEAGMPKQPRRYFIDSEGTVWLPAAQPFPKCAPDLRLPSRSAAASIDEDSETD